MAEVCNVPFYGTLCGGREQLALCIARYDLFPHAHAAAANGMAEVRKGKAILLKTQFRCERVKVQERLVKRIPPRRGFNWVSV